MSSPVEFNQADFSGGMNFEFDMSKLNVNEYPLLINGRIRDNTIQPVNTPLAITVPGSGTVQGVYGYDKYLIFFRGGKAYYKDLSLAVPVWTQIIGFSLSTTASQIYAQAIPASTLNRQRKSDADTANSNLDLTIRGSEACLVCQDGTNQSYIIFPDATTRAAYTFSDWVNDPLGVNDQREYIPIGTLMLYNGMSLYLAGYDTRQRLTQILRSVSGRPADFMVNIDTNGDKPSSETDGGAHSVSHAVSYEPLTALIPTGSDDGAFLACTLKETYAVVPDYDRTIFGEPTYRNIYLMPTGAVGPFCTTDINGDLAFVDQSGIKSFNAVRQMKTEANSNPFSSRIQKLFNGIVQTYAAATTFDNYALFGVNTIYGSVIIVYDTIRGIFVGLDSDSRVNTIRQFAQVKLNGSRRLFMLDTAGNLFEYDAGSTKANCRAYFGEFNTGRPDVELKPARINLVFSDIVEAGTVTVSIYVDRQLGQQKTGSLSAATFSATPPWAVPYPTFVGDPIYNLAFDFGEAASGWRYGYLVEWSCNAKLTHVFSGAEKITGPVGFQQICKSY